MAGRRLLDVAALFKASRGVAQKSVTLHSRQLDVYTRTSTIARAIKNQTDRVTETARAAAILAGRLNEDAPIWSRDNGVNASGSAEGQAGQDGKVPSAKSTEGDNAAPQKGEGALGEDHFYERSEKNTAVDPVPEGELEIKQEKADRYPLPDGTIPPADSKINVLERDQDVVSKIPVKASKGPLAEDHKGERVLKPAASGASTLPTPSTPLADSKIMSSEHARMSQREHENQIPSQPADSEGHSSNKLSSGHDGDSFYEPSEHSSPVLSSLPRFKIPKETGAEQGTDSHVENSGINSDSYSSPTASSTIPEQVAIPEQEEVPEGVNTDLFYSPRISKMLGGKKTAPKSHLELKGVKDTPIEQTKLAEGKDQDTFNVRTSSQTEPTSPATISKAPEPAPASSTDDDIHSLAKEIAKDTAGEKPVAAVPYQMRESSVPSSRFGRLWNYGGLAAGMFGGAISEGLKRATGNGGEGSYMLSAGNMDRLVAKLSRMRGAALKLGQLMSFQDSKMLPAPIQEVLMRVQDSADYMPPYQRDKVLVANLGPDWKSLFLSFDEKPIAAASIGQVHSAVLASNGKKVAVKVQYPGVADSIDSDLSNLTVLLTASRLLPKGLFLDKTIANARTELGWECDYIREAECGQRFQELLADEKDTFVVPRVFPEASGKQVLTMEFLEGVGVTKVQTFTQEQKDWIGTQILRLCLREITEFRFMQTDPNWTNFLYNAKSNKLELLDFGASREYPQEFIDQYTRLLFAASKTDKDTVRDLSISLGYLTGHESKAMLQAHISSVLTLAEPFLGSSPEVYNFRDQTITDRVKALIPVMIKERLAPPPEETYSLHRKLSGAFLLCAKLGSRVRCRELFENAMAKAGRL